LQKLDLKLKFKLEENPLIIANGFFFSYLTFQFKK